MESNHLLVSSEKDFQNSTLSVITPVFCHASTLVELAAKVFAQTRTYFRFVEYIFVNDGSSDQTRNVLFGLSKTYPEIRVINFARNFGQHVAMMAGLSYAKGDFILFIDADLEETPEDIPKLLAKMKEGYEVVIGQKPQLRASFLRTITTAAFTRLYNSLSDWPIVPDATNMRLFTRKYGEFLLRFREQPFIGGMTGWIGLPIGIVAVQAPAWRSKSSYNFRSLFRHARNGLVGFSLKPLRFALSVGLAVSGGAALLSLVVLVRQLIWADVATGYTSLVLLFTFLFGLQFAFIGLLGEYVGEIFLAVRNRPRFLIFDTFNLDI